MTGVLSHHGPAVTRRTIGGCVWFTLMAGAWVVFFGLLLFSEPTLQDLWERVRELPLLVEGLVWLVLFPLVLGPAVWSSDWRPGFDCCLSLPSRSAGRPCSSPVPTIKRRTP